MQAKVRECVREDRVEAVAQSGPTKPRAKLQSKQSTWYAAMSYQQPGGASASGNGGPSYSHIPGLSVGAVPIHYANASDGPMAASGGDEGDQDDQYYYGGEYGGSATPMAGSTSYGGHTGMGFGGYGSGGGTVSGIFNYIRSNRPLSLGIGFFLIMLFLTGGGGSSVDDGADVQPAPPTVVSNNINAPAPVPATSGNGASAAGGSGQQDSVRGQETSRFSGGNGANNSNNNNNNNNNANAASSSSTTATTTAFGDGEIPRGITWLSYFPLSGAYYVSLVVKALGVPTGTNYNNARSADMRLPLFEKSPQGPFARGTFHGPNEGDGTVLVSTHCGGTCPLTVASFTSHHICQPYEFIENILSFDEACRSTYYYDIATKRDEKGVYDSHYVERMIHLIRDPLANVVSMSRVGPSNATGFHALCAASSKSAAAAAAAATLGEAGAAAGVNMMNRFIPSDVKAAMDGVPCPYEFFQYVQWHNLALEEAEFRGLDTLPIYYEDFGHSQDEMVGGIADFLGVAKTSKKRKEVPQFLRARMYDDYYTAEQKRAIWRLIETMALPKTLELLQRYRQG